MMYYFSTLYYKDYKSIAMILNRRQADYAPMIYRRLWNYEIIY